MSCSPSPSFPWGGCEPAVLVVWLLAPLKGAVIEVCACATCWGGGGGAQINIFFCEFHFPPL